jgi:hypothetical protein
MKSVKILTSLLVLSITIYSCDKVKDILKAPIPYLLDETILVNKANGGYTKTITINAADDPDISANLDNIKSYEVDNVSITVTNVDAADPTANISNLNIEFSDANGSVIISNSPELNLVALAAAGKTDLELDADKLEGIKAMIESGEDFKMETRVTVEKGPASFNLTISIEGKIIVGA